MAAEPGVSPRLERGPAPPPGLSGPGPIRPDRLAIRSTNDGLYGIDVSWVGRECILRAVVVRRLLVEAGIEALPGNSQDGRLWHLRVGPVRGDQVAGVIDAYIW